MEYYLYRKFGLLRGDFSPDPRSPEGILKIPEVSTPCPRAGAEARGHGVLPEGIFKIPERAMGILVKIPEQKPEFCVYFFYIYIYTNIRQCLIDKITSLCTYDFQYTTQFFYTHAHLKSTIPDYFISIVYYTIKLPLDFINSRKSRKRSLYFSLNI